MSDTEPQRGVKLNNRWYDKDPEVSKNLTAIQRLIPVEYQHMFAEIIISFAMRHREKKKMKNDAVSLGTEKVLGVYKSQAKRRKSDQDEMLFRAFRELSVLENNLRDFIAERIASAIYCIRQYILFCEQANRTEDYNSVNAIIKVVFERGKDAGIEFLTSQGATIEAEPEDQDELEQFFVSESFKEAARIPIRPDKKSKIKEDDSGMRVHEKDKGENVFTERRGAPGEEQQPPEDDDDEWIT